MSSSSSESEQDQLAKGKSRRGKRGVASFKKNMKEEDYKVEFDEKNRPKGSLFMSWLGLTVRQNFPYWIDSKDFQKNRWEELWMDAKALWKIQNDRPKKFVLRKAKKLCTNFISRLVTKYVNKNKRPFRKYKYLDPTYWKEFVEKKTSPEFLAKSKKAKSSAKQNKNVARVGRSGFQGLDAKAPTIWPQLEKRYPHLKFVQDGRSMQWIMGRAIKNKQTRKYELAPDALETVNQLVCAEREMLENGIEPEAKDDPIIRVLGPEHGGRTRAFSEVIGSSEVGKEVFKDVSKRARSGNSLNESHERESEPQVDRISTPGCGTTTFGGAPIIDKVTPCVLVDPYNLVAELTVAQGQVWPASDQIMNGKPINQGYSKVYVDMIEEACERNNVPDLTKTKQVNCVGDMLLKFVQWPTSALKVGNQQVPKKSTSSSRKGPSTGYKCATPSSESDDFASSSHYIPQHEVANNLLDMEVHSLCDNIPRAGFMDMLMQFGGLAPHVYTQVTSTHAPDPAPTIEVPLHCALDPKPFIDPEVPNQLKKVKKSPRVFHVLVEVLTKCVGNNHKIVNHSPVGMYPAAVRDDIPYAELLQLFCHGWLDITIIHWFEMFLYGSKNCQCVFLNPHRIKGYSCKKNPDDVESYIFDMIRFNIGKKFFVAPFLANNHWSLLIFSGSFESGYVIDSMKGNNNKDHYILTSLIDKALGFQLDWEMTHCKQQMDTWECGYMVIRHMLEFVNTIQYDYPAKLWNDMGFLRPKEIDQMIVELMPHFIRRMFPQGQELLRAAGFA